MKFPSFDGVSISAFVLRPAEHGPEQTRDLAPEQDWDVIAADMNDLARRLGL